MNPRHELGRQNEMVIMAAIELDRDTSFSEIMQRTGMARATLLDRINHLVDTRQILQSRSEQKGAITYRWFRRARQNTAEGMPELWRKWGGYAI